MSTRIAYGPGRAQHADLSMPAGEGPFGVVVLVHGGFWRARYRKRLMRGLAADLAARGWAAWNLEYRRLGPLSGGGWPATFDDVAAGIDALERVDAPLDLRRVVTVGHSAGGHLALWAAARATLPPDAPGAGPRVAVAGAVGQAAVTDLERAAEEALGGGVVPRLLGGRPEERRPVYARASPAARLPLGVPQLLVHGEQDQIVPPSYSVRYAEAARAAGDDVTVVLRSGDGHFEHIDAESAAWASVVQWLQRFEY